MGLLNFYQDYYDHIIPESSYNHYILHYVYAQKEMQFFFFYSSINNCYTRFENYNIHLKRMGGFIENYNPPPPPIFFTGCGETEMFEARSNLQNIMTQILFLLL